MTGYAGLRQQFIHANSITDISYHGVVVEKAGLDLNMKSVLFGSGFAVPFRDWAMRCELGSWC